MIPERSPASRSTAGMPLTWRAGGDRLGAVGSLKPVLGWVCANGSHKSPAHHQFLRSHDQYEPPHHQLKQRPHHQCDAGLVHLRETGELGGSSRLC